VTAALATLPSTVTVGSSDAPAILGWSRFSAPWGVWLRLTGLVARYEQSANTETEDGHMLEPGIGFRYATEHGLIYGVDLKPGPTLGMAPMVGPEPWQTARPDYLTPDRVVEAKAPREFVPKSVSPKWGWGEPGTNLVPLDYSVQTRWQMMVAPRDLAHLAAYARFGRPGERWRLYVIPRREDLERRIVDRVRDWVEHHVLEGNPPPIDGSDDCGRGLALVHGMPAEEKVWRSASAEDLAIARDLAKTKRQIAELEERAARMKHRLQDTIGDAYGLRAGEDVIATWGPRKGAARIDAAALRRDHPAIAETYTVRGDGGRTFRLTLDQEDAA
jgi:predicted phage-related endonuclease